MCRACPAVYGCVTRVADDQSLTVKWGRDLSITLTGEDDDGDSVAYSVTSGPSNGTLSGTVPNLTYTPEAGFTGSDSITYVVNDGLEDSVPETIDLTVNAAGGGGGCSMGSAAGGSMIPILLMLISMAAVRIRNRQR